MSTRPSFVAELKRRNVLRAGVLYAGAVWALSQGISQLGPSVGAPDWVTRWFLIASAIGFPFWIAFAWFYEFTPSGLKRESEIDPADSIAHHTSRKLNYWITGVMALAIVLLLTNTFVWHKGAGLNAGSDTATPKPFHPSERRLSGSSNAHAGVRSWPVSANVATAAKWPHRKTSDAQLS